MRTTLVIDDDVLTAARALAARQNKTLGKVMSALARQALRPAFLAEETRNGVPLLQIRHAAFTVTPETVNQLRDE